MRIPALPDKPLLDLAILAALVALIFGIGLGDRVYSAPSEARYIEIGREMAESGDYVTPRLNYVKYFEKPPLFYWIQAAATKLWGYDSFHARIPTAAFALALCLITYALARMLYGRLAGWLGALVLSTTIYLFALSRVVLLDIPVSVFLCATLTAFLYAANAPGSRWRTLVIYSMYVAAACATLTKGLIGFVIPGAVIFLWLLLARRWSVLKHMRICSGLILFLLISVPWHVLVAQRNPEWAQFYFIHEHFERYLTKEHNRYQPVWFFIPILLAGLFPWIAFAWQSVRSATVRFWSERAQDGNALFLVLWIAFIFIFFSLSDSKLPAYIIPVFPPIAALLGRYFALTWEEKPAPGFSIGLFCTMALLLVSSAALPLLPQFLDPQNKILDAVAQASDEIRYFSIACFVAAAALFVVYIQGDRRHVVIALLVSAAVVLGLGNAIGAHYDRDSMQLLGAIINTAKQPGDEVATYGNYYQDLPLYIGQRVIIVDWTGELEFGAGHEDTSAWIIDDAAFWKRWMKGKPVMFVIMRYEMFARLTAHKSAETQHLYMIRQVSHNVLFANVPPEKLMKRTPHP